MSWAAHAVSTRYPGSLPTRVHILKSLGGGVESLGPVGAPFLLDMVALAMCGVSVYRRYAQSVRGKGLRGQRAGKRRACLCQVRQKRGTDVMCGSELFKFVARPNVISRSHSQATLTPVTGPAKIWTL